MVEAEVEELASSQSYSEVETKDIELISNVGRKLICTVEKNFDLEHERVSRPREMNVRYGGKCVDCCIPVL